MIPEMPLTVTHRYAMLLYSLQPDPFQVVFNSFRWFFVANLHAAPDTVGIALGMTGNMAGNKPWPLLVQGQDADTEFLPE